ncbi:glycosyltransferase [Kovacikia minuta CCNUW1]|uniref:glycosyltransferase family 2 protein n=1 Tax=Kovacikia minuta TaxID=2931930 RepID=UPI001CC98CC6|nr:glycosyltransferase family 2 protein [Kovacikia minuta]UBF29191.1 glycosyltransferase [Kovacikia minuta CCNUW1]
MTVNSPRVSLGLAVYNGEEFVREAIDSVLAQTFQDFELIISDNASTDRTPEICLEYASREPRIRYIRNDRNMGAAWNLNRVFELSTGEYFKLVAHDDVIAPDYLAKCVEVLDQDPSILLCHSWMKTINEKGEILEDLDDGTVIPSTSGLKHFVKQALKPLLGDGRMHVDSPKPRERFRSQVCTYNSCHQIHGMMRVSAVKLPIWDNYGHSDGVFLAKLALSGPFHLIPEYLFFYRVHSEQSMLKHLRKDGQQDFARYSAWWDPNNQGRIMLPRWRILREYAKVVMVVPISWYDRLWCFFDLFRWARGSWRIMFEELLVALRQILVLALNPAKRKVATDDSM